MKTQAEHDACLFQLEAKLHWTKSRLEHLFSEETLIQMQNASAVFYYLARYEMGLE